ncbi:MAG: hypothetical protein J2P37_28560, partial [Ktedonobacteraceae bacterium]|nr:hypothetical protein [Ktedonobacteraceae bacterium]
ACQDLNMPPDMVCRLAGELIALHVIALSQPFAPPVEEMSPVAREMMASGLGNGYVAPGYAAATTSPLSSAPLQAPPSGPLQGPPSGPLQGSPSMPVPQQATSLPFETDSQWGNGGNGAIFVPGRGWVTATQSTQLMPGEAADPYFGDYISAGGR